VQRCLFRAKPPVGIFGCIRRSTGYAAYRCRALFPASTSRARPGSPEDDRDLCTQPAARLDVCRLGRRPGLGIDRTACERSGNATSSTSRPSPVPVVRRGNPRSGACLPFLRPRTSRGLGSEGARRHHQVDRDVLYPALRYSAALAAVPARCEAPLPHFEHTSRSRQDASPTPSESRE
jgi:hypothetical protein